VGSVNRRAFLALGTGAASGLSALVTASCTPGAMGSASQPPVTAAPGASTSTAPGVSAPHPELAEATVAELGARMQRGEVTARALVLAYVARIEALDRGGPALRSILELNPDAASIAGKLDDERRAKGPRGPLHGIPVLLKDNIDTGDRMQTTAGSLALAGKPAPRDAHLVARLRDAGAVVLGKTNLSEWANIRDTHSTSGWSARGGLTRNPYALDRNTSGSSSGSASAIAASLGAVAVGSETDGSIVSPASIAGLVGVKPTVGLVSRSGIIPISHTQDTAGPMARTVTDAAILLGALAGTDPRDAATAGAKGLRDYTPALKPDAARGKRIGAVRGLKWMIPAVAAAYEAALADLRKLGAEVVDVEFPHAGDLQEPELEVLLFELKSDLAAYLAARGGPGPRTLDDVIRFDAEHAKEELYWFGQELFEQAARKGGLDSPAYLQALAACRRLSRDEGIDAALSAKRLDALVAPTGGPAWMTDLVNGDAVTGGYSTLPAVAGYPSVTVPSGDAHGLPLGILFFAGAWSEATLLAIAFAYEQATRHRRPPAYLATLTA
jgi:amidase